MSVWRDRYTGGASSTNGEASARGTKESKESTALLQTEAPRALEVAGKAATAVGLSKDEQIAQAEPKKVLPDVPLRYRAPLLLLFGASTCVLGFFFITAIGIVDFYTETTNPITKQTYASGHGYFPATVSEMVHEQDSPGGRIFHTFGMMSGLCIFLSWYPINLRNVFTGSDSISFRGFHIYWTTARQLLPCMGLWLLVGVNTYPVPVAMSSPGKTKLGCVVLHLMGAGMMFVGYLVCEMKCLGMIIFSTPSIEKHISPAERRIRRALAWMIMVSFFLFCVTQVTMKKFQTADWLKDGVDDWKLPGEFVTNPEGDKIQLSKPLIHNTASGLYLQMKIASFVFEDIAGLSLVVSHLAIWYYCEERHWDFKNVELQPHHEA